LSASFDKPQLGQLIVGPPAAAADVAAGVEAAGVEAAAGADDGDGAELAAGTGSGEPPIGAPQVSHHSVSLLW
jgi:hypothetical protein